MISIANFVPQMQNWIRDFSHNNQEIMKLVNQVQFNQDQAIKWGISILGSGAGNMMNTTMSAVGSIVSGLATFFIAFSFESSKSFFSPFFEKIECTSCTLKSCHTALCPFLLKKDFKYAPDGYGELS